MWFYSQALSSNLLVHVLILMSVPFNVFATVSVNCYLNAGMAIPSVLIFLSGTALSSQSSMLLY